MNFIKIYFKVFIYKIINPKNAQIIQKRDKNFRIQVKTHLGARTGLRKPKNPSLREYHNRDQKYEKFRSVRKCLSMNVKESAEF